ncbi:MAG: LPS export ABC transporter periplasmic protein LptC [Porticoccaceae bacterium]|jgi:LPS export ABC transporter protein LptC|nr:LPS export ABC transporter periplasmic protein LptC [Porticoccaceae bacterium]MBT5577081.1 LPS export ABC transporter periplasmic protein LptC [Porticoccaceae bacterium]MBT7375467.1 LPS export ABC transporter periplasmic protein LptC [Porticoccaceae bacterium]
MIRQVFLVSGLLILISGFLLVWDSPPESFMRQQPDQVEAIPSADSYMTMVTSRRFATNGAEQLAISAPKMEFFTTSSRLTFTQPNILSRDQKSDKNVTLKADRGALSDNGGLLSLNGSVVAVIESAQGATRLSAPNMTYAPDSQIAATNGRFKLQTPEVTLSGKGLDANLANEVFSIKSKVRAIHEPL